MTGTQTYYLLMIRGEKARYHAGLVGRKDKEGRKQSSKRMRSLSVQRVCVQVHMDMYSMCIERHSSLPSGITTIRLEIMIIISEGIINVRS